MLFAGFCAFGVLDKAEAYYPAALGDVCGLHLLDCCCDTGGTTTHLLARGDQLTGFDISLARLADARRHVTAALAGTQVGLLQSAAEMFPFDDGAFDAVLGKQIFHHLDLKTAIPEIARVLRPGGRAVFLEPLIHNPLLEG